jgi:hypothetical protein
MSSRQDCRQLHGRVKTLTSIYKDIMMGIINATPGQTGLVGVLPSIAYINTDDTVAEVTTVGYLNKEVANGLQFSLPCIACVSTKATPTSVPQVGWYEVQHVGANWSLDAGSNTGIALTDGHIFVGNASNIATDVAMSGDISITNAGVTAIVAGVIVNADINAAAAIAFSKLAALTSGNILVGSAGNVATSVAMSGDATIVASGALTIANNAITTAKILNANVTLAKLAAGITPSHVIKFANQVTTVGGAAAEAFTVIGALAATDRAFVQVVNDGTGNVTVLQAVVTNDTLTVTFSADPGNDTVINYQIIRVAS